MAGTGIGGALSGLRGFMPPKRELKREYEERWIRSISLELSLISLTPFGGLPVKRGSSHGQGSNKTSFLSSPEHRTEQASAILLRSPMLALC